MDAETQEKLNADMLYVIDMFTGSSVVHSHRQKALPYVEDKLKQGADPNATYADGNSALMIAIKHDDLELIALLLKHGANPDLNIGNGHPLLVAISTKATNDIAKLLIEHGANVNIPSQSGTTALSDAVRARHVETVKLLLKYGADVNARSQANTPLTIACRFAYPELVELLIEHGADVNLKDGKWEPIVHAFEKIHTRHDERMIVAEKLIQYGAKVDIMVKRDKSLLEFATEGHGNHATAIIEQALLNNAVAEAGGPVVANTARRNDRKRL